MRRNFWGTDPKIPGGFSFGVLNLLHRGREGRVTAVREAVAKGIEIVYWIFRGRIKFVIAESQFRICPALDSYLIRNVMGPGRPRPPEGVVPYLRRGHAFDTIWASSENEF